MIINIFGSSGSGTTTLAKSLSEIYDFYHIDIDDIMWEKTDPPFTIRRDNQVIKKDMHEILKNHQNTIISGAIVNIYDELKENIDLYIYMNLDIETRIKRINRRELNRFGKRVLPGGDLYDKHQEFLQWVSDYEHNPEYLRSRRQHLSWLDGVSKPVLRITDELSIEELLKIVGSYIKKL
ncbi:AAA family ATPase [Hujiaoplasma nucleasis]|uniref:AAA family ATPase n=1 Tax=Hujiaoplasma nucleasis TaxID=2725268 RepID=A0A7L6N2L8_9MOLU|nr:AAA family ATPase [Hujiaoplasma nucleasis]QLY39702.1 AAA family ATPase [Hujiaoplasma nucleasis]